MLSSLFRHASGLLRPVSVMKPMIPVPGLVLTRELASLKHKKIIKLAKGFRGRANRVYSIAYHRVLKAQIYAYRDRKVSACLY